VKRENTPERGVLIDTQFTTLQNRLFFSPAGKASLHLSDFYPSIVLFKNCGGNHAKNPPRASLE
jgi:hypothetical protein